MRTRLSLAFVPLLILLLALVGALPLLNSCFMAMSAARRSPWPLAG